MVQALKADPNTRYSFIWFTILSLHNQSRPIAAALADGNKQQSLHASIETFLERVNQVALFAAEVTSLVPQLVADWFCTLPGPCR